MTHAARAHRALDAELAEALARDGEPGHGGAILPPRTRLRDLKTMEQRQARVLLAQLTECVSARGLPYLKGWLGASGLVGFKAEPDEQGRQVWKLYLAERRQRDTASDFGGPSR